MKKELIFKALITLSMGFVLLIAAGCATVKDNEETLEIPPETVEAATAAEEPLDYWDLLRRGDSGARDFFVGEAGVNDTDNFGKTPLHYAAEKGDVALGAFFVSLGANVNALDNTGQSPLGISVELDDAQFSEFLVKSKANIHQAILGNTSPAGIALGKNSNIVRSLINLDTVETTDSTGKTILHLASIAGKTQAVDDILSILPHLSSTVNKPDNEGKNALDYALERPDSKDHIAIAEKLILKGANSENPIFTWFAPAVRTGNYNIRRSDGFAPIHYAVSENLTGVISFLIEKGVDTNIKSFSGSTPLHEAARAGDLETMKTIIALGVDVNAADAKGNTPMHIGIPREVHRQALALFLENGANPNLRDEHGDTPLHIAVVINSSQDVIQTLLGGGSDVNIRNIQGKTPLYIAIQEKRKPIIPIMLSYGADIFAADNSGITPFDLALKDEDGIFNLIVTNDTVNQKDSAGNTMLHVAVRNNCIPRHIGTILDHRAFVDARNMEGETALHIAVRTDQRENGEYLISRGASIYSLNASGISPLYLALTAPDGIREWLINSTTIIATDGLGNNMLHYAAQWNLDDVIPLILNKGVPIDNKNASGETPLFMAVKTNSPSTVKVLLDNRADINARDNQGNTLLHAAVRWNSVQAAERLIDYGININLLSSNGNSPLHDSVIFGMREMESMLIYEGANLEVRNLDGNTPFMEAVRIGYMPSVENLAANGADSNTRNTKGDTPLHYAVNMERYDLVNRLLIQGASIHARNTRNVTPFSLSLTTSPRMVTALLTSNRINSQDDLGHSALHIAVQEKANADILRSIISSGARIDAIDNSGKTPLRYALDLELLDTAKILSDAGADPFLTASDNRSPADIAIAGGERYIRAVFSGRAINARDSSSNTILHIAARNASTQEISLLLEFGANKTIKNISSETPHDIALRWNRGNIAELLR